MNKYKLVVVEPVGDYKTLFSFNIDEKGLPFKTDAPSELAEIDLYTMQFNNVNDIELELYTAGLIDEDVMIYIEYPIKDKDGKLYQKRLDVMYKKDIELLPFAQEIVESGGSKVDTNSSYFDKFLNGIETKDGKWLDFMLDYNYISKDLYRKIYDNRFYRFDKFTEQQIIEQISSYNVIRKIYVGTKRYEHQQDYLEGAQPGTLIQGIKDLDDIIYEEEQIEDESYKDYSDDNWHI